MLINKLSKLTLACLGVVFFSASAMSEPYPELIGFTTSEPVPSQKSINHVVSYYYGTQDTPILADYKLCREIGSIGNDRNQCIDELSPDSLVEGQSAYLWMNYLVPKGTESELLMHYNHMGITRDTSNFKVSGSIRFRTWKKIKLSRSGSWELPIYFEHAGQYTELDRIMLNVKEKNLAGLSVATEVAGSENKLSY